VINGKLQQNYRDLKNGLLTFKQDMQAYKQEKMFALARLLIKKGRLEKKAMF